MALFAITNTKDEYHDMHIFEHEAITFVKLASKFEPLKTIARIGNYLPRFTKIWLDKNIIRANSMITE